jgi:hypothetical protein
VEDLDGLRVKDREPVQLFIEDTGWNTERPVTPDWLLYLATRMVSLGWHKKKVTCNIYDI